jgi:hypothetical protein
MALYIIETSVYYDQSTLCYTPEGSIFILAAMRTFNLKYTGCRDGSFRNESFQVNDSLQGVVNDQLTEEEGIIHLGTICRKVPLLAS